MAGKVVVLAWLLAVIVNVIVWAHHIYLDYPENSIQSSVNIAMQPLTFSIVAPSAISLYSLSLTIWRSDFQWTPAAKFLAAAMVSWLVAGLSGIVNATIVFNTVVHNTMWIVGHFHNMALLNIGLVVFAGIYAFLPDLTGKQWYSEKLANSHLWLTVIGGYGMVLPMLVQGLDGAPRRYAVLPSQYETLSRLTVPFVLMLALGQVVFAYNLIRSLRGDTRKAHETVLNSFALAGSIALAAVVLAVSAFAADEGNKQSAPAGTSAGGGAAPAGAAAGKQLFADNCGSCHTLKAAGTTGTVGPNLDQVKPPKANVIAAIDAGGMGSGTMPKGLLTGKEEQAVATFVSESAGK